MALAKLLISGVDIWLNTPTRPLEASGTSGEKALMNGVVNFSVLDGWWFEGYREGAGWALTEKRTYENQGYQDQLDAATIYNTLENEIIPMFYATNSKGYSPEWVDTIKNSIAQIAPIYTTKRMLDDYIDKFYTKLQKRHKFVAADGYAKAKSIAAWKEKVAAGWDRIEIVSAPTPDANQFVVGKPFKFEICIDTKEINENCIGIDFVCTERDANNQDKIRDVVKEFKMVKQEGSKLYFELEDRITKAGSFKYAFRMFPKHEDLPHRMDFCYVRWF
jgi:starch phosphorylase